MGSEHALDRATEVVVAYALSLTGLRLVFSPAAMVVVAFLTLAGLIGQAFRRDEVTHTYTVTTSPARTHSTGQRERHLQTVA